MPVVAETGTTSTAEGIENGDLHAMDFFDDGPGHFFAIAKIGKFFFAVLLKQKAERLGSTMWQRQRSYL